MDSEPGTPGSLGAAPVPVKLLPSSNEEGMVAPAEESAVLQRRSLEKQAMYFFRLCVEAAVDGKKIERALAAAAHQEGPRICVRPRPPLADGDGGVGRARTIHVVAAPNIDARSWDWGIGASL